MTYARPSVLRQEALTPALLFGAFTIFYTVLAFLLQEPMFSPRADVAALFGILGLAGVLAAPLAGRYLDARGVGPVVIAASALVLLAWVVFGLWISPAGLAAGVIMLDFGVQSGLVAN